MAETSERLSRAERIAKRRDFLTVYQKGKKVPSRSFVLYGMINGAWCDRLGITVSKKIGKAVVRNKVKRRFREIFRRNKPGGTPCMDVIINARKSVTDVEFVILRDEFAATLERLCRMVRGSSQ